MDIIYSVAYILGWFIHGLIFGCITKYINENKGYDGGFAWGFWLGVIGIIVVACKSDNRSYSQQEYKPMYPSAQITQRTWRCVCGQENAEGLVYCTRCRRSRTQASIESSKKVECPYCGAMNKETNNKCFACGKSLTGKEEKWVDTPTQEITSDNEDSNNQNNQIKLIKQLAELHQNGILTDEEFNTKKAELLSKL